MNSILSSFLKTGVPFGIFISIVLIYQYGWGFGLIGGIFGGILFGGLLSVYMRSQATKFTEDRPLTPDETLIKEGGANHFLNGEAVGGWIYLTNVYLRFKSHNSNIQKHELKIPLRDIDFAEKANTFGIIPNQLRLTLRDGKVEKFVVNGADEWVREIKNII